MTFYLKRKAQLRDELNCELEQLKLREQQLQREIFQSQAAIHESHAEEVWQLLGGASACRKAVCAQTVAIDDEDVCVCVCVCVCDDPCPRVLVPDVYWLVLVLPAGAVFVPTTTAVVVG